MKSLLTTFLLAIILTAVPHAKSQTTEYSVETLAQGLEFPWSLDFLPDGSTLITEKPGRLRILRNGELSDPIAGVPTVYYAGQGGLLDVLVDRDFANNQTIYLSYAYGKSSANATRLTAARLEGNQLKDVEVLFTAAPLKKRAYHYGGRLLETPDNRLMLTVGDGSKYRDDAQKLDSHLGKIIRLNKDGSVPADNPWASSDGALPEIWSMGHRNPQAIVIDNDGQIYAHEHGPKGGDEINVILPAKNYGWPVITRGVEYNGETISTLQSAPGMELPLVNWTPSIAPGGMTWYSGGDFKSWNGDLLVVSLKEQKVRRIELNNGKVINETQVLADVRERMRDIRTAPDGSLYILTDEQNGKLLRISAK